MGPSSPPKPTALSLGTTDKEQEEADDRPPLMLAVQRGSLPEVMRLLNSGVDVNASDAVGETALFEAAASGNADMVALDC